MPQLPSSFMSSPLQPRIARLLQSSRVRAFAGTADREWVESMTDTVAYLWEVVTHLEKERSLRDCRETALES